MQPYTGKFLKSTLYTLKHTPKTEGFLELKRKINIFNWQCFKPIIRGFAFRIYAHDTLVCNSTEKSNV